MAAAIAGMSPRYSALISRATEAVCPTIVLSGTCSGSTARAWAVGEPALLTREQMAEVIEKFKGYGGAAARTV